MTWRTVIVNRAAGAVLQVQAGLVAPRFRSGPDGLFVNIPPAVRVVVNIPPAVRVWPGDHGDGWRVITVAAWEASR